MSGSFLAPLGCEATVQARMNLACGVFEDGLFCGVGQVGRLKVADRVVKLVAGVWVFGAYGPDHFRGEHAVVVRDDFQPRVDARLMVNASIAESALKQV